MKTISPKLRKLSEKSPTEHWCGVERAVTPACTPGSCYPGECLESAFCPDTYWKPWPVGEGLSPLGRCL